MAGIWGRNDDTRGVHKAPANEVVRGAINLEINITKNEHDLLNPVGINCIRAFPGPRHPGVGRPHPVLGRGVALPQRPPALQLPRGVDSQRDRLGGLRTQRLRPVVEDPPDHLRIPRQRMAQGRPFRADAGRGLLRQVRRRDQPLGGHRRRPGGLRDRRRPGQAGGVRDLPAVAVLRRTSLVNE